MAVPWLRILDMVVGVSDLVRLRKAPPEVPLDREAGLMPGALGTLETRLAGVVVAALKEAFDRDSRRLDLERQQMEAERLRAERALRLELLRQAGDREVGRLRLMAGVAVASWLGTLFFSASLIGGPVAARVCLGGGWALLLGALAASFIGQSTVGAALARVDPDRDNTLPATAAGSMAPWLIVLGLALIGLAVLVR
jgi:LPXTG-motif cell wall-anchored protein